MVDLQYKPAASEVIERLRALYFRQAPERICAVMLTPSAAVARFAAEHPFTECHYPDPSSRARFWDALFHERAAVEDDSLPAAYLSEFDQGLYGGLLGGQVRFMVHHDIGWISSMVPPLLDDLDQLDALEADFADAPYLRYSAADASAAAESISPCPAPPSDRRQSGRLWWQRYLHQLEVFVSEGRGRWGTSHFILIDGLNFVFELVGATKAYMCLHDCPHRVRQAFELAFKLNVAVQQAFFDRVPLLRGGTLSNFCQWLPGRVVSESIDPYHMTSVAYFERWGREPAERIMTHFDGGVVHIHGNGRHLLPAVARLKGLKAVLLLDDRGWPRAFDVLEQIKSQLGDVPVGVNAEYEPFIARLRRGRLPGGVLYRVNNVPDVAAANRTMELVRRYRA
jgi:hypothetical protein